MEGQGLTVRLFQVAAIVCFVLAVVGLVIFIYGSAAGGTFRAFARSFGLRPLGLALLGGGFGGGVISLGYIEIIRLLRKIAKA